MASCCFHVRKACLAVLHFEGDLEHLELTATLLYCGASLDPLLLLHMLFAVLTLYGVVLAVCNFEGALHDNSESKGCSRVFHGLYGFLITSRVPSSLCTHVLPLASA